MRSAPCPIDCHPLIPSSEKESHAAFFCFPVEVRTAPQTLQVDRPTSDDPPEVDGSSRRSKAGSSEPPQLQYLWRGRYADQSRESDGGILLIKVVLNQLWIFCTSVLDSRGRFATAIGIGFRIDDCRVLNGLCGLRGCWAVGNKGNTYVTLTIVFF